MAHVCMECSCGDLPVLAVALRHVKELHIGGVPLHFFLKHACVVHKILQRAPNHHPERRQTGIAMAQVSNKSLAPAKDVHNEGSFGAIVMGR